MRFISLRYLRRGYRLFGNRRGLNRRFNYPRMDDVVIRKQTGRGGLTLFALLGLCEFKPRIEACVYGNDLYESMLHIAHNGTHQLRILGLRFDIAQLIAKFASLGARVVYVDWVFGRGGYFACGPLRGESLISRTIAPLVYKLQKVTTTPITLPCSGAHRNYSRDISRQPKATHIFGIVAIPFSPS